MCVREGGCAHTLWRERERERERESEKAKDGREDWKEEKICLPIL